MYTVIWRLLRRHILGVKDVLRVLGTEVPFSCGAPFPSQAALAQVAALTALSLLACPGIQYKIIIHSLIDLAGVLAIRGSDEYFT